MTGRFSRPINVGTSTTAAAIDSAGDVAGFFTNNGGQTFSAFLRQGRTITVLKDPGMVSTQILGLNENGTEAVGDAVDSAGNMFGVTYNVATGGWQNFHFGSNNGLFATTFNGVNDSGEIVGFYVSMRGNTIGLLARPTAADSAFNDAWSLLSPEAPAHSTSLVPAETPSVQHFAVGSVGHG
jgi:hypothetical protein